MGVEYVTDTACGGDPNLWNNNNNIIVYARTAHNRTVYASPPVGGSGYEKPQSGYALCWVFSATFLRLLERLR
jgi:hypothetical protein